MKLDGIALSEVIDGCLAGKSKYQEIVFRNFYGKMMGVCMRYTKDQDVAQDMVQEGFIKVFDKIGKYNFKGSFEGWLRRIVVNTAIDVIRKKNRDPLYLESDGEIDFFNDEDESDEEDGFFADIPAALVVECIQNLPPAYQMVFNLYVVEEYSHKEISEELGISVGTSKSNLSKAKVKLKASLLAQLKKI